MSKKVLVQNDEKSDKKVIIQYIKKVTVQHFEKSHSMSKSDKTVIVQYINKAL